MMRRTKIGYWPCLLACLALASAPCGAETVKQAPAPAAPSAVSVETLDKLVAEWVGLRRQIASEKQDWNEKREQWEREIKLLENEKRALDKTIAGDREAALSAGTNMVEMSARNDMMEKSIRGLAPALGSAESEARKWRARVPPPLAAEVNKLLDQMTLDGEQASGASAARRVQMLTAFFTQIEMLQHKVHLVRELLAVDGVRRREVDVLYLGLARGFAVSGDNDWAAVGTPGADGWAWQVRPGLAPEIRKAVMVYNRQRPAEFVTLPLGVLRDTPAGTLSVSRKSEARNPKSETNSNDQKHGNK